MKCRRRGVQPVHNGATLVVARIHGQTALTQQAGMFRGGGMSCFFYIRDMRDEF